MEQVAQPSDDESCGFTSRRSQSRRTIQSLARSSRSVEQSRTAGADQFGFKVYRELKADCWRLGSLIRFRFRTAVLMAHAILIEQLFHLLRNHIPIVRNGNERDFFPGLRLVLRLRRRLFWFVTHCSSIHHPDEGRADYSKASSEDFSGKVLLQLSQVTK